MGLAFKKETRAQEVKQLGQELRCRHKTERSAGFYAGSFLTVFTYLSLFFFFEERCCGLLALTM